LERAILRKMPEPEEGAWYKRLTRGAPLAVLLAAGLLIAYEALLALELIAVAMLIALVLRTFVRGLGRLGAGPWFSVIILLVAFGAFGAMFWLVLVPNLVWETRTLASQAPGYIDSLANLAQDVSFVPDPSELANQLKSSSSDLINSLPSLTTRIGELTGGIVAAIFLALYMSINPWPLVSGALLLVPGDQRKGAERFLDTLEHRLRGWIVGLVIAVLIVGVGVGLGLWIIGVPLPLTFGILAGLLELVPYIGQIVAALLPALVALTISPVKALLVVVLFIIVNQVDPHIIQPLVMGREVRLPPAIVIISFLILGELLGLVGILLAVPAAVVAATLVDEMASKESSQEAKEAEEEIAPGNFRD
jgi:predicted PurR-regulated permease PerM